VGTFLGQYAVLEIRGSADQETKSRLADTLTSVRPDAKNGATEAVRQAPVVIVVCGQRGLSGCYRSGDNTGTPATDKGEWWLMFDLGLAMQNITLAAHSLGLGTVHVGMFDAGEVRRILDIPEDVAVVEVMPLSWPAEEPQPRPRKDINELVSYEGYFGPEQPA